MSKKVKSGQEMLSDFFNTITDIEGVDIEIAEAVRDLYLEGKLTDKNLSNELEKIRRKWLDED